MPSSDTIRAFYASLSPADRQIHELAAALLKTRYDVTRSNAFLKYIAATQKPSAA